METIGWFARTTGLSVKALRHYDEVGLLRPARVDAVTGYRYYEPVQARRGRAIRLLRELEVPLDEIAALLDEREPERLRARLVEHRRLVATRAARLQIVLQRLQPLLDGKEPLMETHASAIGEEAHRRLGIDLFNEVWTLLGTEGRTPEQDDAMVHAAHASAHHWRQVGTPANHARSEWQCSRVYAVLGRAEPALHHARRCLRLCEASPEALEPWDLPYAHEALARAHAVAGEPDEARRHAELARGSLDALDADDRELLVADLATLPGA